MAETVNGYTETDLGNVAPNPRGDYSETGEYEYLDLVAYAGGSYMCILAEGTVTGTAPTPGKTTEIWQEVSRPGNLTPEYVALHDDVVNKAASVAEDAASVASDREQVEGMKENVAALQKTSAQDAQLAKEYRESAAGYASAAETSRTAAGESEENVRALVNGFDDHVEEQKTSAQDDITTSRQAAINAIAAQQVSSVNTVKQEGQKAINKTNADAEATAADRAAVSEMATTVDGQAAQVAQNAAQVAEDKATAENYMQTAGESKKQALEAAERLKDSVNLVQKNTVDLQGKAPAIIGSATSYGTPVEVNDSAEMQLQGLRLYGKSKQVVTTGKNHLNHYLKKSTTVNGVTCVPNGDGTYTLNGTATEKADFIVFTISKISSSSLFGKTLKIVGCPPGGKRDSKYAFYFQRQLAPNYTPIIADEGNKISESLRENNKADKLAQRRIDVLWKLSQGIVYEFQSDDTDGYKKDVPPGGKYVGLKQIGGKSLVWGQLLQVGKHFFESVIKDHFYLLRGVANVTEKADVYGYVRPTGFTINTQANIGKFDVGTHKINCIIQAKENNSGSNTGDANFWCGSGNATFDNINLFDLTAIFGAGNEPSTVEEFEAMFPDDYYPYSDPEVVHASIETVESVGKNSTNTLIIPEAIRNLDGYGWSAGNVYNYVDFENKKFHKRVGCVDLGTLEWTSKTVCYFRAVLSTIKPGNNAKTSNGCCKKYLLYDANNLTRVTKGIALGVNQLHNVDVWDENYTDVTTFKTAMSGVLLYYELATEEVTDISDLLAELDEDAFMLPVEPGGTLTFKNPLGDGYRIPVPNSEEYILKLSEVASNE